VRRSRKRTVFQVEHRFPEGSDSLLQGTSGDVWGHLGGYNGGWCGTTDIYMNRGQGCRQIFSLPSPRPIYCKSQEYKLKDPKEREREPYVRLQGRQVPNKYEKPSH
jgi:hypothetical protein